MSKYFRITIIIRLNIEFDDVHDFLWNFTQFGILLENLMIENCL